jgi:hypothetical protein
MNRRQSISIAGNHHPENARGEGAITSGANLSATFNPLMQLHLRTGAMRQRAGENAEHGARSAVERTLLQ